MRAGFSLLEIMVVIALMGVMAALIVPRFTGQSFEQQRDSFVEQLNSLTIMGWRQALNTGKLHRILFDFSNEQIRLETEEHGKSALAAVPGFDTTMKLPDFFTFSSLSIADDDVIQRGKRATAWFYIVPQGLAQQVEFVANDEEGQWRAQLNPFTAQFSRV